MGGAGAAGGAPGALKTPAVTPTPRFPQSQLKYRQFAERLTQDTQIRYHIFVLSSTKSHLFLCLTPDIKQTVILKSGASLWMTSPTFKKMNDLFKRLDVSEAASGKPDVPAAGGEQTAAEVVLVKQGYFSPKKLDNSV